jgi:uncharacterized protein
VRPFTRALVTGASGGIGEEIARELAARSVDLVLVARSGDALEQLATELGDERGVDVEVLTADLLDEDDRGRVERRLETSDDPVDLLVNNAGFGTSGPFLEDTADRAAAVIQLNAVVPTRLTRTILPRLVADRHGGVLNVSSMGGFQPVPGLGVYAATKAYVTSFTEAVHEELRGSGVRITALCPGFTRTGFIDTAGANEEASRLPGFVWQQAPAVARAGVDGVTAGKAIVVSGTRNQLTSLVSRSTPSVISRRVIAMVTGVRER